MHDFFGRRWVRVTGFALVAVILLGLVGWAGLQAFRAHVKKNPSAGRTFAGGVTVQASPVRVEELTDVIGATSAVESLVTVHLRALVSAKIESLHADLGSWVKPGEVLARMDQKVLRATLETARTDAAKARAELEKIEKTVVTQLEALQATVASARDALTKTRTELQNSQLAFTRTQALYDKKVVAMAELEAAQGRLDTARAAQTSAVEQLTRSENDLKNYAVTSQAQISAAKFLLAAAVEVLARAERDFKDTTIVAPLEGIVLERKKSVGETPVAAEDVFTLGALDSIYVVARVAEEQISRVHPGNRVEIVFDSFPNDKFTGTIVKIDPTTDVKTRTFPAYAKVDNIDKRFKPGLTAYTRIEWKRKALTVPRLAVVKNATEASVFVVRDGHARILPVKVIQAPGERMEVVSGLQEGELVIHFPVLKLKENDPVIIDTSKAPAPDGPKPDRPDPAPRKPVPKAGS
jgi:RND family efflux transporter MFP subunit